MSPTDVADCVALNTAIERYNHGLPKHLQIDNADLARDGALYGGSSYRQLWWAYRRCRRPIPVIDKMIIAVRLDRTPQELFRRWPFPQLTPVRPSRGRYLLDGESKSTRRLAARGRK